MTHYKKLTRSLLVLLLAFLTVASPLPAFSQQATVAATATTDFSASLAAIEKAIDVRRQELGIPGLSLAIVKDDKVIYLKGLGYKDFEKKVSVTPDTIFAIGSSSKAFTALTAVMSQDQGKLSLDDSPKKFLPYFHMRDPETDAKITIRDLLSHRSGLNRTDIAMVTNKLNRAELIQVAGMAKPTAKLGEKFQYQNVMYTAAGEAVARAQHSTWDRLMKDRIFKPLGMKTSNTTAAAMQKSRDFSFGYEYNPNTKVTRRMPQRQIPAAAPAGAINSSAREMSQWVRLMLGRGVIDGKRLVSEAGFNELLKKQMNITGNVGYGLGWFLRQWNGHQVVEHGGNIDGFNAQVAMMPDQNLGFVLLTNVTGSPLGAFAMNTVWANLVGMPKGAEAPTATTAASDPNVEVGTYKLVEAGIDFTVNIKDGKLNLSVPGQPTYALENVGGRRYKLAGAPVGFFVTFRPIKEKPTDTEMFLEQPQGNVVLPKNVAAPASTGTSPANSTDDSAGPLREMIGSYENETKQVVEIAVKEGKVSLLVPNQQPYPLEVEEPGKLRSPALPEAYWVEVKRDSVGSVAGIVINQPEGQFKFRRIATVAAPLGADELIRKMIDAYGGEANLKKHHSSVMTVSVDMEHQGLRAEGLIYGQSPDRAASTLRLLALNKEIGTINSFFDGQAGGEVTSFTAGEMLSGKRLEDVRRESNFYGVLAWKQLYKTITVKSMSKVGEEDAYVLELVPAKGNKLTAYVSAKSFLILRIDRLISNENTGVELPQTEYYSDYRLVDGWMIPFKVLSNNIANGDFVTVVKDVKFDVEIPEAMFKKPVQK